MKETRIYDVDRYHAGIRLAVLAALFVGIAVGAFMIVPLVTAAIGLTLIPPLCSSIIGGVLLGAGLSWLTEQILLRIWPSGRRLTVDTQHAALKSTDSTMHVEWGKPINVLSWRFVVPRTRTFVPKGWFCLSCRLSQNDQAMTLYTFANPAEAQNLPQWSAFEHLISQKDATGPGSEHVSAIVAEQGQLRAAERDRWEFGAEMARTDFFEFMATVDAHIENWPD